MEPLVHPLLQAKHDLRLLRIDTRLTEHHQRCQHRSSQLQQRCLVLLLQQLQLL
jgi:hypothetical protein